MIKSSQRWRGLRPTGKSLPDGSQSPGKPILVRCSDQHVAVGLCGDCLEDFRRVLADVPALLDDLDVAIAGGAQFVDHGARQRPASDEDGAAGSGSNPAIAAHQRLVAALEPAAGWFDARHPEQLARLLWRQLDELAGEPTLRPIAHDVSSAAARVHRVIDGPPDLVFYGPCPDCGKDIWQERIWKGDTRSVVRCRFASCGYAQPLDEHNQRQLEAAEDRWMTVAELVSAFESAGEPINRDQINGWIRRDGLPREERPTVRWRDGKLERTGEVWTYRLGDVRDMALRASIRSERRHSRIVGKAVPTVEQKIIRK